MGLQACCFMLSAWLVFMADTHGTALQPLRSILTTVVLPLEKIVHWPSRLYHKLNFAVETQQALLKENQQLRAKQLLLELRVQKLTSMEAENKSLRALLKSSREVGLRVKVAEVIDLAGSVAAEELVIDQGAQAGVFEGQAALDAQGVMGQVVRVSGQSSRVMLLTDPRSAIPVENSRTGLRSIVEGMGPDESLKLMHVPSTEDVQVGDQIVTSGLGDIFPQGYPVGAVVGVTQSPGDAFMSIAVQPAAKLNRARLVLLLWSTVLMEGAADA